MPGRKSSSGRDAAPAKQAATPPPARDEGERPPETAENFEHALRRLMIQRDGERKEGSTRT